MARSVQAADLEGGDVTAHIMSGKMIIDSGGSQNVADVVKAKLEASNGVARDVDEKAKELAPELCRKVTTREFSALMALADGFLRGAPGRREGAMPRRRRQSSRSWSGRSSTSWTATPAARSSGRRSSSSSRRSRPSTGRGS